jgi:hypothetical protein
MCPDALLTSIQANSERVVIYSIAFLLLLIHRNQHSLPICPTQRSAYLQLLRTAHKARGQRIQYTIQIHALQTLQINHLIAARKEARNYQPKQPAEPKYPRILPLVLALLLQRVQLFRRDDAQVRGARLARRRRGFAGFDGRVTTKGTAEAAAEKRHGMGCARDLSREGSLLRVYFVVGGETSLGGLSQAK